MKGPRGAVAFCQETVFMGPGLRRDDSCGLGVARRHQSLTLPGRRPYVRGAS